jgi:hypothetical protein
MVGTEETIEAVMTYVNAVGPAFLELVVLRAPIMYRQTLINAEADPSKQALIRVEQARATQAAAERGLELSINAGKLLPNAILAIRKEMDLPIDRALLLRLWEEQFEAVSQAWARSKEQLKPPPPRPPGPGVSIGPSRLKR